ncbi:MAG: transketolase [Bacteroidetes bacterium]|nr:transketolase [Bacteroidota bacterium]
MSQENKQDNINNNNIDTLCINTIRTLSMDAVQKANSGHPGMPMGAAPMAHVLWGGTMNYNPDDTQWLNRDRFVLSAGHGCMLQYSILHLAGYKITMEDLKNFRQLHSITPGHPEYGLTPGIETTTGPLGQGFATGVGMAVGQKYLAAKYNKPGFDIFNYRIFGICSDGDLMEGISAESASFAGHLKLGNIIYFYDDNHISIEGDTSITFTDDTAKRFESYGWQVLVVDDVNDIDALNNALESAIKETEKPSLIKVRTHIAYGSPNKHDTAGAHGSPLGEDEVKLTKEALGFDPDKSFFVPSGVYEFYKKAVDKNVETYNEWNKKYSEYKSKFPELAAEFENAKNNKLNFDWEKVLPVWEADEKGVETRKASGKVINALAKNIPLMIGGSADLSPSNDTEIKDAGSFSYDNYIGRNFHFGVREHSMGAELNGMNLTPGIIAYGATFLIFSDYMKPAIRLAAIMKLRTIFIYTHDSVGLGEDGTTHQPIEQLIGLRAIPNLTVIRPADANETAYAWQAAIECSEGPTALALTRQKVPVFDRTKFASAEGLLKGAYVLSDSEGTPDVIFIATGSEVQLAVKASESLAKENIKSRVVSMPSWELFEKQSDEYKNSVLPKDIKKRVVIEAASPFGWCKYSGDEGVIIGIDRFGESAPAEQIFKEFGFTVDNVVNQAKKILGK